MKKLVIKSLFCLLFSSVVILVLNLMYMRTSYWKYENDVDKFMNVPGHIQLANVGSSHGELGFGYTDIPYRSFNFALSGQRYIYDYAILQQYIDNFDKNAVLIILVEYFEITQIKKNYSDQIARYYRFLDKEFISDFSTINDLRYAKIPVLSSTNTIFKIILDTKYEKKIAENIASRKLSPTLPNIVIDSKNTYYSWSESDIATEEEDAKGFAYNKNLVSKMIELCIAHDIQPVLIATPIIDVLNNLYAEYEPEFFDTFSRFTREIRAEYPSVPYFDYSRDPRFENDYTLFADSNHLNFFGAEKFTAIVVADLQAAGLLDTPAQ
jgi:hypothetical protein